MLHVDNTEGGSTDVLVKLHADKTEDPASALKNAISGLNNVSVVGDVQVKEKQAGKEYTSVYARLRTPRYKAFKDVIPHLTAKDICVKKIAGQDNVQVKCIVDDQTKGLPQSEHATLLYTYGDSIHPKRQFCLFDVPVGQLQTTIKDLTDQGTQVEFIHNF